MEDLEAMFALVDEMTTEQAQEPPSLPPQVYDPQAVPPQFRTEAMAAMPKAKLPIRRSAREGAGRRRVQFSNKEPDRWQQIPRHVLTSVHQAGPSTSTVQPSTTKSIAGARRPTVKSTVRHATSTPKEVEEEREDLLDLSRMPRSFPIADQRVPTPGTTILHEPPEGTPEAPPTIQPTAVVETDVDIEILDSEPSVFSNLQKIGILERMLATVTKQLTQIKGDVFQERRTSEQAKMAPMPVLTIMSEDVARATFERCNEAQKRCGDSWAMATLDTNRGQLETQGFVPKIDVVDSGAARIILGKSFAKNILLCGEGMVTPAGAFLTANGEEVTGLMKTTHCLTFTLAKGTTEETKITAKCLISETDVYDVLLDMEFLGATFGFVHPLTSEFIWYVDCKEIRRPYMPSRTARIGVNIRGPVRASIHLYMCDEITCAEDLLDAVEGDEETPVTINTVIAMAGAVNDLTPMLVSPTYSHAHLF